MFNVFFSLELPENFYKIPIFLPCFGIFYIPSVFLPSATHTYFSRLVIGEPTSLPPFFFDCFKSCFGFFQRHFFRFGISLPSVFPCDDISISQGYLSFDWLLHSHLQMLVHPLVDVFVLRVVNITDMLLVHVHLILTFYCFFNYLRYSSKPYAGHHCSWLYPKTT